MNRDLFPIFDPISLKHLTYKRRKLVHSNGDWHMAIQANVIRRNNKKTFDILVQTRSKRVDIARDMFDQGLASHMIKSDCLDPQRTLKRGLLTEVGITKYCHKEVNIGRMYISKKYKCEPEIYNREILKLYIVLLDSKEVAFPGSFKVAGLKWMEWTSFKRFFLSRWKEFTKTSQFYFLDKQLIRMIENYSFYILGKGNKPKHDKLFIYKRFSADSDKPDSFYFNPKYIKKYGQLFD